MHISKSILFTQFFLAILLSVITSCSDKHVSVADNGSSSVSPYSVTVEQADGTKIDVIGKGNRNSPYTETLDGYTILRNNEKIFEYAITGKNNNLELSGIKARNAENRSKSDIRFLKKIDKHLRNSNK